MKVLYDKDADLAVLKGKRITVLGYGSQGHAHAQNLRDGGHDVRVGLRPDSVSRVKAEADGFEVCDTDLAVKTSDLVMVLIPDEMQPDAFRHDIGPNLREGQYLGLAHGFCVHFSKIVPPPGVHVFLVAPKGPGHLVRRQFEAGSGVPCLVATAMEDDAQARGVALAYASAIGGGRAGVIETTFREETETDLFGEQAVLCGGLTELIRAGFETLTDAGYAPEMAYFECLHEMKLIVDLVYEQGITGMRDSISNTAEYGDITRGKRIIGESSRAAMKKLLADIQSGAFANEWMAECQAGKPKMRTLAKEQSNHPIEQIGPKLRAMMTWLNAPKDCDSASAPKGEKPGDTRVTGSSPFGRRR